MRCDYLSLTMDSRHCLEYQARARGKTNGPHPPNAAVAGYYVNKYKCCLDCAQGQLISKGEKDDRDVEKLKNDKAGEPQKKYCKYCDSWKELSEFYEITKGSGKYTTECKVCTKKRLHDTAQAKKIKFIDQAEGKVPEKATADVNNFEKFTENHDLPIDQPVSAVDSAAVALTLMPVMTKICAKCMQEKSLTEFYRNHKNTDGLESRCKDCQKYVIQQERLKKAAAAADITITLTLPGKLVDRLYREGTKNFRTVEGQAAYILHQALEAN